MKIWLQKNWWKILIVPLVFVLLYRVWKFLSGVISKRVSDPDLFTLNSKEDAELKRIEENGRGKIAEVKASADKEREKIDNGETSPSEIFNRETEK